MDDASIEHTFITTDMVPSGATGEPVQITFNVIEDESGDIFWGHGHVDPDAFVYEINRWLVHVGAITVPEDYLYASTHKVEHFYAKITDEERFTLTESDDDEAFPVTRLML